MPVIESELKCITCLHCSMIHLGLNVLKTCPQIPINQRIYVKIVIIFTKRIQQLFGNLKRSRTKIIRSYEV